MRLQTSQEGNARIGRWRFLAVVLALISASIHLLLSVVNLIPGETTVGLLFAAMGVGYVMVAGLVFRENLLLYQVAALYTAGLLLAFVASRLPIDSALPIEPVGLATKVDEGALLVVLLRLIRGLQKRPRS